jgi:class 3 adenylate cyclase
MTQPERRTRGFLFADLRGYTAFVEANGDDAAAELLVAYRALVRGVVARFGGAEIKTEGDSFYVVFPSASAAVDCGLELVAEATAATAREPVRPIRVGVGVHAGDTIEMDDGYVGSAVNVAARVCSIARPGEVAVSETVRGLVRTALPVHFVPRGTPKLKGISQPIAVYAVRRGPAPTARAWRRAIVRPGPRGAGLVLAAAAVAVVASLGGVVLLAQGPRELGSPAASEPGASGGAAHVSPPSGAPAADEGSAAAQLPGEWIAYERRAADPSGMLHCASSPNSGDVIAAEIRAVRPDASGDRPVLPPGDLFAHQPSWTPDGQLAFVGAGTDSLGVQLVAADGSDVRALSAPAYLPVHRPAVDTAGRLAWLEIGDDGQDAIRVLDGPGASARAIKLFGAETDKEAPVAHPVDVSWAPGDRLGVVLDAADADATGLHRGSLSTIGVDGTGLEPTLEGAPPVAQAGWSPDGTRLALTVWTGDRWRLAVAPVGAEPTILDPAPGGSWTDRDPTWSPDGARLAFASDRSGRFEIYTIGADGAGVTQVTTSESTRVSCAPTWSRAVVSFPDPPAAPASPGPVELARGWLPGGRVHAGEFDPPFAVTVPPPDDADPAGTGAWQAWGASVDGVWLRRLTPAPWVDVDIGRVTVAYPGGCLQQPSALAPATARDLIETLQGLPLVEVSAIRPVEIGRAAGIQIDLIGLETPADCSPPNRIFLFATASGQLFVRPGEHLRLIAVDAASRVVVIIGRADDGSRTGLASQLAERLYETDVQPVIDSIAFDDP